MTPDAGTAHIHIEIDPADLPVFEAQVKRVAHAELASLGGHLLAKYGQVAQKSEAERPQALALATLGGYLLEAYTDPGTDQPPPADDQDDDETKTEPEIEHVEGTKPADA